MAGETRAGAGDAESMRTSSSTVYNSEIVCSFRVSVPEAQEPVNLDGVMKKNVGYYLSCQRRSRKWSRALQRNGAS
jgi:hypothetical protein